MSGTLPLGVIAHMSAGAFIAHMPLGAFIAHMSAADFFGLVVTVLIVGYLFYALIRGEKL